MNKKIFLQRLYELKNFLREHPEQKPVYSDIPVDLLIMQTKRELYEEEENKNVQDRQDYDDFVPATGVPF